MSGERWSWRGGEDGGGVCGSGDGDDGVGGEGGAGDGGAGDGGGGGVGGAVPSTLKVKVLVPEFAHTPQKRPCWDS